MRVTGDKLLSLVVDLRIVHDRFESSWDPSINGTLHYPNDVDRSLNEVVTDKIRKYRDEYKNRPPTSISFMSTVVSTSDRVHSEFVSLLFLQAHRETDRFFAASKRKKKSHTFFGLLTFSPWSIFFDQWVAGWITNLWSTWGWLTQTLPCLTTKKLMSMWGGMEDWTLWRKMRKMRRRTARSETATETRSGGLWVHMQ